MSLYILLCFLNYFTVIQIGLYKDLLTSPAYNYAVVPG